MNSLLGFRTLFWATFKQSLRSFWPWILAIVVLSASSYAAFDRVFPTPQDQQNLNATVQANPAFNLIFGAADSLLSAEGFTAWRSVVLGSFLSAMMSILLVVKYTRDKEDSGEEELLASSVVGRYTLTAVALLVTCMACLLATLVSAGVLLGIGADAEFAVGFGLTIGAVGVLFAAITALVAQIVSHSRTAISVSVTVLGAAYLLRGIADTVEEASWMAHLSPLGWAQRTNLATDVTFAPVVWLLAAAVAVSVVAFVFKSQRDFGQGVIADRPGRPRATRLYTVHGLAYRLQKSALLGWSMAFVALGIAFGYLLDSVGSSFATNDRLSDFVGASAAGDTDFVLQFAATLLSIVGIIAATYCTQIMYRLLAEESAHRSDSILAGGVSRVQYFLSHTQFAVSAAVSAMLLAGAAVALTVVINAVDTSFAEIFLQAVLTVPAVLIHLGIAVLLAGYLPRLRWLAWAGIAISFGLTLLGPILELSDTILALTPFWHIVSVDSFDTIVPTMVMCGISVVLIAAGFFGYNRRDIARV